MAIIGDAQLDRNSERSSLLRSFRISPRIFLVAIGLYAGGVLYGIWMSRLLFQPWIAAVPDMVVVAGMLVLTVLYLRGQVGYQAVLIFACVTGVLLFQLTSMWWVGHGLKNQLAVISGGIIGGVMFSSLLILFSRPWLGMAMLGLSAVVYIGTAIIVNSRYSLVYLGLVVPAEIFFGVVLLMFRQALEAVLVAKHQDDRRKPPLDLKSLGVTEIEYRCIGYALQGLNSKEIAAREGLTVSAVNNRFSTLYRRVGVLDRAQLTYFLGQHELFFDVEDNVREPEESAS